MSIIRYELKGCKLMDMETGAELLTFEARAVRERTESGGWAGSGISSGGHSYGIATPAQYNFVPQAHKVVIGAQEYVIISKHPVTPKRLGERFTAARPIETVLELA